MRSTPFNPISDFIKSPKYEPTTLLKRLIKVSLSDRQIVVTHTYFSIKTTNMNHLLYRHSIYSTCTCFKIKEFIEKRHSETMQEPDNKGLDSIPLSLI